MTLQSLLFFNSTWSKWYFSKYFVLPKTCIYSSRFISLRALLALELAYRWTYSGINVSTVDLIRKSWVLTYSFSILFQLKAVELREVESLEVPGNWWPNIPGKEPGHRRSLCCPLEKISGDGRGEAIVSLSRPGSKVLQHKGRKTPSAWIRVLVAWMEREGQILEMLCRSHWKPWNNLDVRT